MKKLLTLILFLFSVSPVFAAVKGEEVTYNSGDTVLKGYIAYDDAIKGKRPGVIVVPDWWGIGKFTRDRADVLATMGYTAMVMDSYGNGRNAGPAWEAEQLMKEFTADPNIMRERFLATRDTLSKHQFVNSSHIAAIGYSLGGLVVLEMARQGVELDGVASFWGVISKPNNAAQKGQVKAKVLVLNPEKDKWAPPEALQSLQNEMIGAGTQYKLITYPKTGHGFGRPDANIIAARENLSIRYDEQADKKSWNDLSTFLKTALK